MTTDSTNLSATDNPILVYWRMIESGQVVVCEKIRKVYQKLVRDLADTESPWFYDPARADHAITFIEHYCKHSKGALGGQPFLLEPWQKAMTAALFGFVNADGIRKYREFMLIVARKNGKSALGLRRRQLYAFCRWRGGARSGICRH